MRGASALRSLRYASLRRSCDQRPAAEAKEAEKEGTGREGDRQNENDLDEAPEAARRLADGERQAGHDNDDDRDDLGDRDLNGIQELLRLLLPQHSRPGRVRRGDGSQADADSRSNERPGG